MGQALSYLICATPRTGSNFLCEVLSSLGTAGHPEEYFRDRSFWYERWKIDDFRTFFDRVRLEGTTANRVFGAKLMWEQVENLVRELGGMLGLSNEPPPQVLEAAFPSLHYVWLRRNDRIRQGISYYRALETKRWRSTDVHQTAPDPPFNFEAICSLIQLSEWEDEGWREFFAVHEITPLVVTYESLAESPEMVVGEMLAHLGLEVPAQLPSGAWQHHRQADALTDEWAARYAAQVATSSCPGDQEILEILRKWSS